VAELLLLLDTGDALVTGSRQTGQLLGQNQPLGDKTRGEAVVAGMNLMGYDAMALGPIDLALGLEVLRQRMAEAGFAMISANVTLSQGGGMLAPAYVLLTVGSRRLGILGLTRAPSQPLAGLEVGNAQEALARWLPEVEDQADYVILLTNLRFRTAIDLVSDVEGVDLLVAALPGQLPSNALRVPQTGTLAVTAEQAMTLHSGRRVGELGLLETADRSFRVESWRSVEMSSDFPDDLEMQLSDLS
jgi:2',3'-cyclic-nucleotide 2'-phosphodiesterase (5'-nucleotidase family)